MSEEERSQRQSGDELEQRVERLLHELLGATMRYNDAVSAIRDYERDERVATQVQAFVTVHDWRRWGEHLDRVRARASEWTRQRDAWRRRQREIIDQLADAGVPFRVWFRVDEFGLRWDLDGCEVRPWHDVAAELGLSLQSALYGKEA